MGCDLLHHHAGRREGNIYLCAEEPARQALVNVMVACRDVARMVNRSVAFNAVNRLGDTDGGVHMERSKQHHRHIYRQYHPRKQPLLASDAVMC